MSEERISKALAALDHPRQLDEDGIIVGVSREALDILRAALAEKEKESANYPRLKKELAEVREYVRRANEFFGIPSDNSFRLVTKIEALTDRAEQAESSLAAERANVEELREELESITPDEGRELSNSEAIEVHRKWSRAKEGAVKLALARAEASEAKFFHLARQFEDAKLDRDHEHALRAYAENSPDWSRYQTMQLELTEKIAALEKERDDKQAAQWKANEENAAEMAALRKDLGRAREALEKAEHGLIVTHNLDASDDPERGFLNSFVIDNGAEIKAVEEALKIIGRTAVPEPKPSSQHLIGCPSLGGDNRQCFCPDDARRKP